MHICEGFGVFRDYGTGNIYRTGPRHLRHVARGVNCIEAAEAAALAKFPPPPQKKTRMADASERYRNIITSACDDPFSP